MNPSPELVEIPLSKSRLLLMLLGALGFVAAGAWFIIKPPVINNAFWGHPLRLAILGYAAVIFFGFCTVILLRKLPDKKPGLIIDESGLTDQSSPLSAGKIWWTDLLALSVLEIQKQKMLVLEVRNPQEYIERQEKWWKRKSMQMNYKMYGTPLIISTSALKMPFDEIWSLINIHLEATNRRKEGENTDLQRTH